METPFSKGDKPWREWMFGAAPRSPKTRGIADIEERAARLTAYEQWGTPTRVDFAEVVGAPLWQKHWENHAAIVQLMRDAEATVEVIRARIAAADTPLEPAPVAGEEADSAA